ncbi:MAG: hypothetical protein V4724_33545 [Pseudomonadota bacterium]
MQFGERTTFAIEAMSEVGLQTPSAVWGRMQIWCQGAAIGDYTKEHCGLFDAYDGFKQLDAKWDGLWTPDFEELSDLQIWNYLDWRLYGCHDNAVVDADARTVEECRNDWQKFGDFNFLTNWGEQFDQAGKSFILCRRDDIVSVLKWSSSISCPIVLHAPLGSVRNAIRDFSEWFEIESKRLSGGTAM